MLSDERIMRIALNINADVECPWFLISKAVAKAQEQATLEAVERFHKGYQTHAGCLNCQYILDEDGCVNTICTTGCPAWQKFKGEK